MGTARWALVLGVGVVGSSSAADAAVVGEITQVGFPGVLHSRWGGPEHGSILRHGKWAPLQVSLRVEGAQHFSGWLRIEQEDRDGDKVDAQAWVTLTAGAERSRTVWLYFQPKVDGHQGAHVRVRLVEATDVGQERNVPIRSTSGEELKYLMPKGELISIVNQDEALILDISSRSLLPAVQELFNPDREAAQLNRVYHGAHCSAASLPDAWLGLEMIDYLVWDDADPTALDDPPRQLAALAEWIRQGGCLLVATVDTWDELARSALGPLLPIDAGPLAQEQEFPGLRALAGTEFGGDWPESLPPVTYQTVRPRPRARPIPGDVRGDTIFFERQVGHGRVVAVPASLHEVLKTNRLASVVNPEDLLAALLGLRRAKLDRNASYGFGDRKLFPALRTPIDFRRTGSAMVLIAVLFVTAYILIATFGSWHWLSRRGWLKHSWSTFAVLAAAASALAILGARSVQGIRTSVRQIAIVDGDTETTAARAHLLFGLKTPTHQILDVWLPDRWSAQTAPGLEDTPCWLRAIPGSTEALQTGYAAAGRYRQDPRRALLLGVPLRATLKQLEGYWSGELRGRLRASIRAQMKPYNDYPVPGEPGQLRSDLAVELRPDSWIANDLGVDLVDSYLLHATTRWPEYERTGPGRRDDVIFIRRLGRIADGQPVANLWDRLYREPPTPDGQIISPIRRGLAGLGPTDHNLSGWHQKLAERAFAIPGSTHPADEVSDDFARAILMITTLDEYGREYQWSPPGSTSLRTRTTEAIYGGHGRHLDRSHLITPQTALFLGFADAPGPARLKVREAGQGDDAWWTLHPRRSADPRTVYRITIPIPPDVAMVADRGPL